MSLYKQWGVTHYTFDVIVLTSSEKSFSRLHHRIFLIVIDTFGCLLINLHQMFELLRFILCAPTRNNIVINKKGEKFLDPPLINLVSVYFGFFFPARSGSTTSQK